MNTTLADAPVADAPVRGRARRRIGWLLRTGIPSILLSVALALLLALVVVPRLLGWAPLTVLSGSMEPTIPTGSQIVVEPVLGEEALSRLEVGDIITFMPYPDDPTLVTHRIVGWIDTPDGAHLTTQGDANNVVDSWDVTATQVRGEVRYWVPGAGYLATTLSGAQKSQLIVVAAGALGIYAAVQLIGAGRAARQRP